jgi:hypothetical protein
MSSTISIAISVDGIGPARSRPYLARLSTDATTATAVMLIAGFTAAHTWLAMSIGLGVDEAYSLAISRDLALSYFDHPPLHLWIAHFAQMFLGNGRIARLPFVAMSAVSSYFLFRLTRELFGARAGIWSLLAFNLSGFFLFAAGCWILPDGPLDMCLLGACLASLPIVRASSHEQPPAASWLKTGIWIGLAALSKYHGLVFALGFAAFLVTSPRHRRLLRTPAPYLGAGAALLIFAPVLIWNAQHGWASFVFQGGRAAPHMALNPTHLLAQVAGEALVLFPWIAVPFVIAVARSFPIAKQDERHAFLLWAGIPIIALCTIAPFWGSRGMPHWPMPGWLLLYPLLGACLAEAETSHTWPRNWLRTSAAAALAVAILGTSDAASGWIGRLSVAGRSLSSPTIETMPWDQLRADLLRRGFLDSTKLAVFASDWKTAGKIDQAVGDRLPVFVYGRDTRGFAFRLSAPLVRDGDGLFIAGPGSPMASRDVLDRFGSEAWHGTIYLGRDGRHEIALQLVLLKHYRPPRAAGAEHVPPSGPGRIP